MVCITARHFIPHNVGHFFPRSSRLWRSQAIALGDVLPPELAGQVTLKEYEKARAYGQTPQDPPVSPGKCGSARIRTERFALTFFWGTRGMGLPGSARLRPGPPGKLLPRPLLAVHCRREMFDVMCNIPKDTSIRNAAQCFFV